MWLVLFLVLPLVGIAYVAWHVWLILPFANVLKALLIGVGVASLLSIFLNFSRLIDKMPLSLGSFFYEVGNSSLFILLYLVIIFMILDLARLIGIIPRHYLYNNGISSLIICLFVAGIFIYGNIHYRNKVREVISIDSDKINKPVKAVLISDMHLGYHNRREELAKWINLINKEHPDVVLIGGDIIDISIRPLQEEQMAEEFRRIQAPVYACLGNHEYYSNEPDAQMFYKEAGIHLLRDSVATFGQLCIIGRDDRTNSHRESLNMLMKSTDMHKFSILLDHQPYHLEQAERAGVDFQFSGHTHRGQMWPISWITDAIYECSFGRWQRGKTHYYISSGIGIWGAKFRVGTQSEYIVLYLS